MQHPSVDIPNLVQPEPHLLSGGQPTPEALRALREAGCGVLVNLRPREEFDDAEQAALARELGLEYVRIPIAGPQDLNAEAVELLERVLCKCGESHAVLVHCASGNRVGALLALHANHRRGMDPEQALAYGERSGLQAPPLRAAVREKLKR